MKFLRILPLMLSCLLAAAPSHALSTDRDQPAEIEADDIEFDFKKGTRTYLNNVLVVQGSLRIKADKVSMVYKNDDLELATAWGSLARFKQRPDGKQVDTEGWGRKIIVDQKQNTITLIGKAALKQGENTARGDTIVYNMATDTMSLKGGAKVGAAGKEVQSTRKNSIEDPFTDNSQGPPEIGTAKPVKTAAENSDSEDPDAEIATTESDDTQTGVEQGADQEQAQPEATSSGRSRLIIQPK